MKQHHYSHTKKCRKARRGRLFSFCFALLVLATSAAPLSVEAVAAAPLPVSPGLQVLAEDNSMAMAALRGNDISFDREDFSRAMNLSDIKQVKITKIPPIADGELRVGSTVLNNGETLNSSDLALLTYSAKSSDVSSSSFRFCVNGSPVEMTCHLYLLDRVNHSPTLHLVPKTSLDVSTHRNITLYGTLSCYDPDGDKTTIEIVSYPETGLLNLTNRETGEYTFTPGENYAGKDSFTYVARDVYGNYSAAATVNLTVTKPSTSVIYADMEQSPDYNAALTMTEAGIMSGTQVGSATYFYPDKAVSRGDFVVMAMNTLGIREVAGASSTDFADDAQIPAHMRGYIATARELGYIQGEVDANGQRCFHADRAITRAEAAVIIGQMIDAATPTVTPTFADSSEIPAWAASSLYSMTSLGIMTPTDGSLSPASAVTRGDAAQMLATLMQVVE